ncbi:MAG TPA: ABC transporter permease, partial [Gemmatimonadaceae bacterium]|nr:ABC transporter permease [Gemmatimonadaceae bacterium]
MPALALRHAARRLRRAPAFTLAATLTLALGIGAVSAAFALVNGVLLEPLPFAHADRLVDLSHTLQVAGLLHVDQSDATYLLYRDASRSFSGVAAYRSTSANFSATAAGAGAAPPERVAAAIATPSLFRVLGVGAQRGPGMTDADAQPGAAPVVVLSHA